MDPEYFNHAALNALVLIKGHLRLGDLVEEGYRVVYETTEAIDRKHGEDLGLPYFLQAADISTPFINVESMICVAQSDWERYPKGRIKPGELLIEVKGKAEKIAIVPEDFPSNTLVSGTCFKLTAKSEDDHFFMAAFLTCRYGQILKDRLKSNLLVSYLAKDDLYGLPVPIVSGELKTEIRMVLDQCFTKHRYSAIVMDEAESSLIQTLGLESWRAPEPLSYVWNSKDAFAADRFDAEYFYPAKIAALEVLDQLSDCMVGDFFDSVRSLWQPANGHPLDRVRNYDLTDALSPFLDAHKEAVSRESIASTKKVILPGDLVVSRLRSYLKEIAIVRPGSDLPMVASTEFIVLRPKSTALPVEALLIYLRSSLPQLVFKWSQDGSNHQRFDERELLNLPVPRALIEYANDYVAAVQLMIDARQRAKQLLDAAKRAVEIAIESSESDALAFLDQTLAETGEANS